MPRGEQLTCYPNPSGSPSPPSSPTPGSPLSPSSEKNMNSTLNEGQLAMRCGYDQDSPAVWCSFRIKRPVTERPAIEPDHCPLCLTPVSLKSAADVIAHRRKGHGVVSQVSAETLQTYLAPYGYWYCNRDQKYIRALEGKPSPDGMRPYISRKCEFCPSMPLAFQPMHPSQLVPW